MEFEDDIPRGFPGSIAYAVRFAGGEQDDVVRGGHTAKRLELAFEHDDCDVMSIDMRPVPCAGRQHRHVRVERAEPSRGRFENEGRVQSILDGRRRREVGDYYRVSGLSSGAAR